MKTQHTPGPWHVRRISRFYDGTPQDFDYLAVNSACGNQMSLQCGATGEFAANARLIAAAPDLLSALRSLVDLCDQHMPIENLNQSECRKIGAARAIISKVERLA